MRRFTFGAGIEFYVHVPIRQGPDRKSGAACAIPLRRLQAEKQLADWNRAREIRFSALRPPAFALRWPLLDQNHSGRSSRQARREPAQKKSRRRPDHNKSFSNDQTIIWMLGSSDKEGNWIFSGIYDREWQASILPKLRGFESMNWAI